MTPAPPPFPTFGPDIPHALNKHIYQSLVAPPTEHVTLCGFEGPEKLIEVSFKYPAALSVRGDALSALDALSLDDAQRDLFVDDVDEPLSPSADSIEDESTASSCATPEHDQWHSRRTGLRTVPRAVWDDMLEIVKARVLSTLHNEHLDAYLLSESSLFVYPDRVIIKTCGTTTLLNALPRILEIAKEYCGMSEIDTLFYSRKAFLFPEKQLWPHGRWGDEVAYLDDMFPAAEYETGGYVVGKINGDHWCLYMATMLPREAACAAAEEEASETSSIEERHTPESCSSSDSENDDAPEEDEVTLEIMMTGLDPAKMKHFWRTPEEQQRAQEIERGECANDYASEYRVYKDTGIQSIYPDAKVDHFLFDPCGYSINGILGKHYFTYHVTPEEICSYASFETTIPVRGFFPHSHQGDGYDYDSFEELIHKVIQSFGPSQFSVTLFTHRSAGRRHGVKGTGLLNGSIEGFKRKDRIGHSLGKWDLIFCHYEKAGGSRAAAPKGVRQLR
ncbi:adenosylmethionine decarboxylase [Polychytrium aggregatum]|uniref:adenosylmethionine decarboxylase n=1 Tax=Polychytrium aggregatum TaxID=110093 RepID=UPI0022FED64F|nr:adenosylmethionine decarboxylase [Polychytrium aggregatum]KAI9203369.1 adenosylmethionine decarboxylase [Polychytrium aggregatum]